MKSQLTLEEAQALGHESIEDAEQHDKWIQQSKERASEAKAAVQKAIKTKSNIIDVRHIK